MGRNRDEWMLRVRRMGSCPCKQPGRPIARFRSNPSGKCLAGRSAALRRLLIAELSTAHRALHPIPTRNLRGPEKAVNTFSGQIGTPLVSRAAPDGYTLMVSPASFLTTNKSIFKTLPYDPEADFVPVTKFVNQPMVRVQ